MEQADIERVVQLVMEKMGLSPHPDQPSPAQEYFSIKNCAAVTGLSQDHIRKAVVGGTLVASDVGTKDHPLYRIHKSNLDKWMVDREAGAKPPPRTAPIVSKHLKKGRARKSAV